MNQHTHTAGVAGGAPTEQVVNVNDVIDNATFKPFHWQVLFWCLLIIIFDGYDLVIYGVALPLLMEQWSLTPVEAGMLASSALVGMMFGAMIFGTLADKFGRKKIIMVCTAFFSGFTFLGAFAPSPTEFAILRFLAGLGIGDDYLSAATFCPLWPAGRHDNRLVVVVLLLSFFAFALR